MIVSGAGVTRIADIGDNFSLMHKLALTEAIGITLEVSVVIHEFLVRVELIDGGPAAFALEESNNLAIGSGDDRGSRGGGDIDGVMHTSFGARI